MEGSPYNSSRGLFPSPSQGLYPSQGFSSSSNSPSMINGPCAACKILRRRCAEKFVLAPYFPRNEPLKFTVAHKVFGAK